MANKKWCKYPIKPKYYLSVKMLSDEYAKFNYKRDTKHFEDPIQEDDFDMFDNLTDSGWAYED